MESSFKKAYEKTTNSDGSIDLKFKAERIGAHFGSGVGAFLILLLYPVSCAVTYPVASMFGEVGGRNTSNTPILVWNVVAIALFIIAARMVNIGRTTLTIKPKEGIVFNGKQLPFKDIHSIGTVHETTGNNPKGNAYVSAQSHGTEVKVTRYVRKDLAEAIAAEIRGASGKGRA
jgi:hypothetical protein